MATAHSRSDATTEAAIFLRLWDSAESGMTPDLARHVLRLGFSAGDRARMHDLAAKSQEGKLSASEQQELANYIKVGDLLALLQSRARKLLRQSPGTGDRNG